MKPIDEFGWCFASPKKPPHDCRWCGRPLFPCRGGILACANCDHAGMWPSDKAHRA